MMLTPEQLADLRPHPVAALFPMIADFDQEGFGALTESVADLGVTVPLVLHEGLLLDGRNRRAALLAALERHGVAPDVPAVDWADLPGEQACGSPLEYVLTHNLARRHLTASQRAIVAANVVMWERGVNQHTADEQSGIKAREVAARFSVSESALYAAKRIRRNGAEELSDAVRDGRLSVHAAGYLLGLADDEIRGILVAGGIVAREAAVARRKSGDRQAQIAFRRALSIDFAPDEISHNQLASMLHAARRMTRFLEIVHDHGVPADLNLRLSQVYTPGDFSRFWERSE